MSAVPTNNKRERQSASRTLARHSGEGRNPELAPDLLEPSDGDAADEPAAGMVPLKCVSSKIADGSHNPPPKQTSGVPMLSARNISEIGIAFDDFRFITREAFERERKRVDLLPGDVLLTIVGSIGRAAVVPESSRQFAIQRSVAMIRPRGLDSKFCMYQLRSDRVQKWLREHARGSAQQGVYLKTLANLPMLAVPLARQHQIVAEIEKQFTRLDAGVAALRRVQANLKRYRAAVLKAACEGRLVPTEAELAKAEDRTYETGEQLLARILADRRKNRRGRGKYKEPAGPDIANLPPLPEGWTWATVAQLSTLVQYGSSAKTNEDSTGIPVLRMGNIQEGKFDLAKLKYLPSEHDEFPGLLLARGDLLFNRTNSAELVGKTAVFKASLEPCSFASYLIRVRFGDAYTSELASYFINSVYGRAWINGVVSQQVGQANVNGTKLQALAVPLPPLAEQTRIVAEVDRHLSIIEELEAIVTANIGRAIRLHQSVLIRAFGLDTGVGEDDIP